MKIAYLLTRGDSVGGASIHVRDLASAMQQRGHQVMVLLGGCGPVTDEFSRLGVPFRILPHLRKPVHPSDDARAIFEARNALTDWPPDLVSTHTAKAGFAGRAAARLLGIPAIYTPHGWAVGNRLGRMQGRIFTLAEKLAAPWTAAFVDVCEAERRLALDCGIGRPEQHVVIHNGVHDVGPELRANPGEAAYPVRIVSIARFEPPKDHETLFAALAGIRPRAGWHLDLVGDGPLESAAIQRANEMELGGQVTFHGYVQNPAAILAASHLSVLSSRSEAFPRSILEAMRAGLPVIASSVGGVSEAVRTGPAEAASGRLFPPGDPDTLRSAIMELMESPRQRQRMGEAGHLTFGNRFRFEHLLSATEALYGTLLER